MLVRGTLRLAPLQRFVIFADCGSRDLAPALYQSAKDVRAGAEIVWLDPLRGEPLKVLPEDIVETLGSAQASAFVATSRIHEQGMRQHLLHLVATLGMRHAHMPGISRLAFATGLRGDYRVVAAVGKKVLAKLQRARAAHATSPSGTDLSVTFDGESAWFSQLGVLELGRWGTLPAGALHVTPASVDGVFVANASVGEFFGAREGLLRAKPLRLVIQDSVVVGVDAPAAPALARDLGAMLRMTPESARVCLVTIGVNQSIEAATGEVSVDQNLPGLHLGIGDPTLRMPGAAWNARAAFAACQADATVDADGEILIEGGRVVGVGGEGDARQEASPAVRFVSEAMAYEKPTFVEIKMDAEIGSYQADYDPFAAPPVADGEPRDDEAEPRT